MYDWNLYRRPAVCSLFGSSLRPDNAGNLSDDKLDKRNDLGSEHHTTDRYYKHDKYSLDDVAAYLHIRADVLGFRSKPKNGIPAAVFVR